MPHPKPHPNIPLLRWHNFFLDFRPYGAIAIIYFAQVTGSYALALGIFSIASIATTIFEVPTGIFSDRIGRKKTIILGSIASVLALTAYAAADSFAILALGAVLEGLAVSLFSGNNDALLYDTLKQENKLDTFPDTLGKLSSMFQAGLGISALVGGFIAVYSLKLVVAVSIIPQIICLIISFFIIEPQIHTKKIAENIFSHLKEAWRAFATNAKLRKLSLAQIITNSIGEVDFQFLPAFFATLWPTWALGIARSLNHLFGFLGFQLAGKIVKKFKAYKTLLSSSILGKIIGLTFIGFPNVLSPIMLGFTSFTWGIGFTASQTLIHKEFTDAQRATMASLSSFVGNLVFAVFAVMIGLIADQIGPAKTLLIGSTLLISVPLIYWNLFKKHRND